MCLSARRLVMMLTLMLTSKGVAGVPRASLVILAGTLATFNLPVEGIALILGVDTLMDMCRTSVNLLGNCLATAVVARWEGVDLQADRRKVRSHAKKADPSSLLGRWSEDRHHDQPRRTDVAYGVKHSGRRKRSRRPAEISCLSFANLELPRRLRADVKFVLAGMRVRGVLLARVNAVQIRSIRNAHPRAMSTFAHFVGRELSELGQVLDDHR